MFCIAYHFFSIQSTISAFEGLSTQVPVGVDEGLKHDSSIHCDELTDRRSLQQPHQMASKPTAGRNSGPVANERMHARATPSGARRQAGNQPPRSSPKVIIVVTTRSSSGKRCKRCSTVGCRWKANPAMSVSSTYSVIPRPVVVLLYVVSAVPWQLPRNARATPLNHQRKPRWPSAVSADCSVAVIVLVAD